MRDAMNDYRLKIKGKMDYESESETEPLVTSSSTASSLTKSFGTIRDSGIFRQESETSGTELEASRRHELKFTGFPPIFPRNKLYPSLEVPELDIYTHNQLVYDNCNNYARITGTIDKDSLGSLIQKLPTKDSSIGFGGMVKRAPTNNSLVTIFAIWNTTMGSSLLAMSWGLEKSGLFPGIVISLFIAAISLYTSYVIIKVNEKHGILGETKEMPDLCRLLIGRWAEMLAKVFSLVVLIGANIVYWILMSNFLYNSVRVLYGFLFLAGVEESVAQDSTAVICPEDLRNQTSVAANTTSPVNVSLFDSYWDLYSTVPVILAFLMFPLLNFQSPTFFTKFNSLGTISVMYIMCFVTTKASIWGINIPSWSLEFNIKPTFCALSGMLSLSYFIHNIIISIMKNNKHQQNNGRDITVAFGLVTFTYLFMGVIFYISFPLAKACIQDNILNNFDKYDTMTIIARLLLLFQLSTVFPLLCFMLRNDVLTNISEIFKKCSYGNFSYGKVIVINIAVLTVCILFACFMPRIGTLIRYTGAMSGLVYIYMLPSLLKIASLKKEKQLTTFKLLFHSSIVLIGVINLFSQFFITD